MNFIQQIIDLILKLITGKAKTSPKKSTPKGTSNPIKPTPKEEPKKEEPETKKLPEMVITEEIMNHELYLGHYDKNAISRESIEPIIQTYHKRIIDALNWQLSQVKDGEIEKKKLITKKLNNAKSKLRHGDTFSWVDLKPLEGNAVKTLQTFLVKVGIFPETAKIEGFFGYGTQAGVRLFQEYERTFGNKPNSIPNGVVDTHTWKAMKDWQTKGKKADKWSRGQNTEEFNKWIRMLENGKTHYLKDSHMIIDAITKKVDRLNSGSSSPIDTIKIQDWQFDDKETHLIGIRRNEDNSGTNRVNDDLFILLINGMVFKFWGSTDPRQLSSSRQDEAFLVEGQHKFRFGWHKISSDAKLYQGLNPYNKGVLVFRDDKRTNDNKLTDADILKGIDNRPNQSINIHWTGIGSEGRATWSAGCQVMASKSYIDNHGNERDCSGFLFSKYSEGSNQKEDKITKTKGAYNMFTDLLVCFRPNEVDYIYYTLARDENLAIEEVISQGGDQIVSDSLKVFNIPRG